MHLINHKQIKELLSESDYRKARYLGANTVKRLSATTSEGSDIINVLAKVSDSNNEQVIVNIKLDYEGHLKSYSCKSEDVMIKVGQVLLYLAGKDIESMPYIYEEGSTELIETYSAPKNEVDPRFKESLALIQYYYDQAKRESQIPVSLSENYLKVEVGIVKDKLDLNYKLVHEGTPYKIKNVKDFLKNLETHAMVRFSSQFSLVLSEDVFDEDSKDIIHLMKQMNNIDDKSSLDLFYDTLSTLPIKYSDKGFNKIEKKIDLMIEENEDAYILSIHPDVFEGVILSKRCLYSFEIDYVICHPYNEATIVFLNRLKENNCKLFVPKKSSYDFYKYVYKQVESYMNCNTDVWSDFHTENSINLYCDINDDHTMIVQLEYLYDDMMVYGFENYPFVSKEADIVENYIREFMDDIKDHIIYFRDDDELVYHFVLEGLPYLSNYCNVFASETLKSLGKASKIGLKVGLSSHHHLLEIDIDTVHINKDELYDVLKAYKNKRKYYKLKNGKLLSLDSGELKELSDLSEYLNLSRQDFSKASIELPEYRLFNLEGLSVSSEYIDYKRHESYTKCLEGFNQHKEYKVPEVYAHILRDYQQIGYQWLNTMDDYGFGGILADDMGLGKTIQMLSYLENKKGVGTSIVITPASLILNWNDEFKKFHSNLSVLLINGNKEERISLIQSMKDYDLIITSYDYLRRDLSLYENFEFECIVLDEAQYIKNPATQSATSVKRLKGKHRFALTGTPIENSLTEIWSIFDFLMPYYLYSKSQFSTKFEVPIVEKQDENKQQQLKNMISPFILRRNKKEVLKELPEKIEQDLYYHMSDEEEKYYLSHLVTINKTLQQKMGIKNVGKVEVLSMLMRLREICQDPRILDDSTFKKPSTKIRNAMALIKNLNENHQKILLFSSFTSVLSLLEEECKKERIRYYRLDGSVNKENRKKMVDAFQKDETPLFLISLKAGGTGLNLTSATAVIHFDPWWNMSVKSQATDRTHRIGQKETVHVYSLYMKNSIEEKIHHLQKEKMALADHFVEGNKGRVMNMTLEDLTSLFEIDES